MEQPQVLRSLILPLQGGQAILPNSSLVDVLPYTTSLQLENAPPWMTGTLLWRNLNTPLVSLEWLIYDTGPGIGTYSRIIMIKTFGKDPKLPFFGLLGTSAPHMIDLKRTQISVDEAARQLKPGVLSWVKVNGQRACIPDLGAIEAQLVPFVYILDPVFPYSLLSVPRNSSSKISRSIIGDEH